MNNNITKVFINFCTSNRNISYDEKTETLTIKGVSAHDYNDSKVISMEVECDPEKSSETKWYGRVYNDRCLKVGYAMICTSSQSRKEKVIADDLLKSIKNLKSVDDVNREALEKKEAHNDKHEENIF